MGDLIRMPGVEVERPQRRHTAWPNMVLASLIVGMGLSTLLVLPGLVLTMLLDLGRAMSCAVSVAAAVPQLVWFVLTMQRMKAPEIGELPPDGFRDEGENCEDTQRPRRRATRGVDHG
jgi:hypothetical protein